MSQKSAWVRKQCNEVFAKLAWGYCLLRRERSAKNPIGDHSRETILAIEVRNRSIAHRGDSGAGMSAKLPLGFAARAFHSHRNVSFVGHFRFSGIHIRSTAPRFRLFTFIHVVCGQF